MSDVVVVEWTLPQQVKAGAAWLDGNYPGWAQYMEVWGIDMRSGNKCILGQIANGMLGGRDRELWGIGLSGYAYMLDRHGLEWGWAEEHGFALDLTGPAFYDRTGDEMTSALESWIDQVTVLWISEVCERL